MLPHIPHHDNRACLDRTAFHLAAHASRERREALSVPRRKASSRALRGASFRRARASRRGGQALLLAVLLMVFAALLGSTFITVVALNLNQTARQENLSASRSAAQSGISFINDRLTNSAQGLNWRPESVSLPPRPSTSDFNFYYTALERAKGWTRTVGAPDPTYDPDQDGVQYSAESAEQQREQEWLFIADRLQADRNERCFVKVPDPRGAAPNSGGPQYLMEVRADVDAAGASTGLLKLTVIGQSEDNPNTFEERVAYKDAASRNPMVAAARTVTNWDFVNNVVPTAEAATLTTTAPIVLAVAKQQGRFPAAPFYITIGGTKGHALKTALVISTSANQLTLSGAPSSYNALDGAAVPVTAVTNGERVQVAAALGSPSGVDYDVDRVTDGATVNSGETRKVIYNRESVSFSPAQNVPPSALNARVNGGLIWMGNVVLGNGNVASNNPIVRASGLMAARSLGGNLSLPRLQNYQGYSARLVESTDNLFPLYQGQDENGVAQAQARTKIVDGLGRLTNATNSVRNVEDFVPPSIEGKSGDLNRYRELTQYSQPVDPTQPSGALYGYGYGIYIDNRDDVEKVGSGARFVPMPTERSRKMLMDSGLSGVGATNIEQRFQTPRDVGTVGSPSPYSLEEKHLRGWISPDEFRARGVLIELDPRNKKVIITREALADSNDNSNAPVSTKVWRNGQGNPITGVYRQVLGWPRNGVIFTEGNARVKGGAFQLPASSTDPAQIEPDTSAAADPGRSITIVSMGNLYIDGSLNAGPRKVALLARKNVILNPTTAMESAEGYTLATAASTGTTITVADPTTFRQGEWIEAGGESVRITAPITTNELTVNEPVTVPLGGVISITRAPLLGGQRVYSRYATRIGRFSDAVQRRVFQLGSPTEFRLPLRHNASQRDALALKVAPNTTPATTAATMTLKEIQGTDKQTTLVRQVEKRLTVNYMEATAKTEYFPYVTNPGTAPANDAEAGVIAIQDPSASSTDDLLDQMPTRAAGAIAPDPPPLRFVDPDTKILENYGFAPSTAKANPLFFFLAAVGNRYNHAEVVTPGAMLFPRRQDVFANAVTIPMGTSVQFFANGTRADLQSDHYSGTAFEAVKQLGFSPAFSDNEDALTIDRSFYQGAANNVDLTPASDNSSYTLDTRRLAVVPTTDGINTVAVRLNNDPVLGTTRKVEEFFRASGTSTTQAPIPFYRLSRIKMEGPTGALQPFVLVGGQQVYQNMRPAYAFDVRAFIYAQEGSWMVIPGGEFDEQVKTFRDPGGAFVGSYLDYNNDNVPNAGEYLNVDGSGGGTPTFTAGDGADLNRDGEVTREEQVAPQRFRRYNYRITFTGAIMEGKSDPVLTEATGTTATDVRIAGAAEEAMNSWATIALSNQNFATGGTATRTDQLSPTTDASLATTLNTPLSNPAAELSNITYNFDASVVTTPGFSDQGFQLPPTPDLRYQD